MSKQESKVRSDEGNFACLKSNACDFICQAALILGKKLSPDLLNTLANEYTDKVIGDITQAWG